MLAGLDSVPVLVYEHRPDGKDLLLASLQANAMRLDMDDFEYAGVYAQLMQEFGWSQAELAGRLKVAPSTVSKRMRVFLGIPEDMRMLFGKGGDKLCGRAAYAISLLPDDAAKRDMAKLSLERNLRVEVVEGMVRDRLGKRPPRPKALKLALLGMTLTIPVPDAAKLKEFITKVQEALKTLEKLEAPLSNLPGLLKSE